MADHVGDLCAFIDAAPSPYHAVAETARMLAAAGFVEVGERDDWTALPAQPRRYVVRDGALVAWCTEGVTVAQDTPLPPYRIIGAHTDSPNLRIKPLPDQHRHGWDQLGVEVYGGPLLNSWLDRDLGLSGRVTVRTGSSYDVRLVRVEDPVLRIPQLAIHLDRAVAAEGLKLNPQSHLVPVWGATGQAPTFAAYLAGLLDVSTDDILGWDVMTHDLTPARRLGRTRDLIAAGRLDNLASVYAGALALIAAADSRRSAAGAAPPATIPVLVLFDHEEVGSVTSRGAAGPLLPDVLERISYAAGRHRADHLRSLAASLVVSADMAHAIHPNYPERHEPDHTIQVGGGPVLKINANARYATDAVGAAEFRLACERAGVAMQTFVSRTDMPCGSTIGPATAAATGVTTVDVGAPMLSMHSARELCGAADIASYVAALSTVLDPAGVRLPVVSH